MTVVKNVIFSFPHFISNSYSQQFQPLLFTVSIDGIFPNFNLTYAYYFSNPLFSRSNLLLSSVGACFRDFVSLQESRTYFGIYDSSDLNAAFCRY